MVAAGDDLRLGFWLGSGDGGEEEDEVLYCLLI